MWLSFSPFLVRSPGIIIISVSLFKMNTIASRFVLSNIEGLKEIKEIRKALALATQNIDCIEEEERYDGFYAVATNLEISDLTDKRRSDVEGILSVNAQRYKIEECFRLLKTNFSSRPVYHHNKPRIKAHFMICYTALLIFRILQKELDLAGFHFTPDNIVLRGFTEDFQNLHLLKVERPIPDKFSIYSISLSQNY